MSGNDYYTKDRAGKWYSVIGGTYRRIKDKELISSLDDRLQKMSMDQQREKLARNSKNPEELLSVLLPAALNLGNHK